MRRADDPSAPAPAPAPAPVADRTDLTTSRAPGGTSAAPILSVSERMPSALPALMESVVFGTSGLRYRRLDAAAQLARLHDPVFVSARDGDALVGAYVLDRRALLVAGARVPGVYRGGLCVTPDAQGRGIGLALARCARAWIDERATATGEPHLAWGCIDDDNHRSLAVLRRQGAVRVGGLAMFTSYCQWPRDRLSLEPLSSDLLAVPRERDGSLASEEAEALEATRRDCTVRDLTPSGTPGLALVDGHGIRVSARVAPSGYRIETMGAALDTLVRLAVTPFPPARRRFDPHAFRYVRLADITLREGCEGDWPAFVSTVLARHDTHFAMSFLDPTSRLHERLRRIGALAPLLHSRRPSIGVLARWSLPGQTGDPGTVTGSTDRAPLPHGPLALAPIDG